MADKLATMIIKAGDADLIRPMAAELSPGFADNMFQRAVGPVGKASTTHYISTGWISERFIPLMQDGVLLFQACQQMGLKYTLAQCEWVVLNSVVREGPHEPVLEELELELRPAS